MVALIPARGGSKRIPRKNVRPLQGHPLLAYAIRAAQDTGLFDRIIVSTDDYDIAATAREYDADIWHRAPRSGFDQAPDIWWVEEVLPTFTAAAIAILRPTAPFRTAATIHRAYQQFWHDEAADSLRAVQPVTEHPGKMWGLLGDGFMQPFADGTLPGDPPVPLHSAPMQRLPPLWVQNASLEMVWTRVIREQRTISGTRVRSFFTEGYEGFDLNTEDDWEAAERLLATGRVTLPTLTVGALSPATPTQ